MKKSVTLLASIALCFSVTPAWSAETQKSVAIIDSYFDASQLPASALVLCAADDACNTQPATSANVNNKEFDHGTVMAKNIISQNPYVKLVLIRSASTKSGKTLITNGREVDNALKLVPNTVSAVSISLNITGNGCKPSSSSLNGYAPIAVTPTLNSTTARIAQLKANNIAVIAAAGNAGSRTTIDYPACIPDVIAISTRTTDTRGTAFLANNANYSDSLTDFVFGPALDSSNATSLFAGNWSSIFSGSFADTYAKFSSTAVPVHEAKTISGIITWIKYSNKAVNVIN